MNDSAKWIMGIAGTLVTALLMWVATSVVEIKSAQRLYTETIPKPVEDALREIREKTNAQAENCNKAQGTVSNNTTEISNLKERVTRLENHPRQTPNQP